MRRWIDGSGTPRAGMPGPSRVATTCPTRSSSVSGRRWPTPVPAYRSTYATLEQRLERDWWRTGACSPECVAQHRLRLGGHRPGTPRRHGSRPWGGLSAPSRRHRRGWPWSAGLFQPGECATSTAGSARPSSSAVSSIGLTGRMSKAEPVRLWSCSASSSRTLLVAALPAGQRKTTRPGLHQRVHVPRRDEGRATWSMNRRVRGSAQEEPPPSALREPGGLVATWRAADEAVAEVGQERPDFERLCMAAAGSGTTRDVVEIHRILGVPARGRRQVPHAAAPTGRARPRRSAVAAARRADRGSAIIHQLTDRSAGPGHAG